MSENKDSNGLSELRAAVADLKTSVDFVRNARGTWDLPPPIAPALPSESGSWNFFTFEKYINQRFIDLGLNLRERYEAQQTGLAAALAAAEKAVNAALIAAEKAVDKAENAQQLRNIAQNEFRQALTDLSKLMWTRSEGEGAVDALRREISITLDASVKRIGALETLSANLQGRMWAISAVWAVVVLGASIAVRFIGH